MGMFGNGACTKNLNTGEYQRIIRYHVIKRDFPGNNVNRQVMWWQQDGAPAHTSNVTLQYLRSQFLKSHV